MVRACGAGDGLPDPPGGVGAELVPAAVFEFVNRFHQPDIAFLDEVEEMQSPVGVLFGDAHHQPQVGLGQLALGGFVFHPAAGDGPDRGQQLIIARGGVLLDFSDFPAATQHRLGVVVVLLFGDHFSGRQFHALLVFPVLGQFPNLGERAAQFFFQHAFRLAGFAELPGDFIDFFNDEIHDIDVQIEVVHQFLQLFLLGVGLFNEFGSHFLGEPDGQGSPLEFVEFLVLGDQVFNVFHKPLDLGFFVFLGFFFQLHFVDDGENTDFQLLDLGADGHDFLDGHRAVGDGGNHFILAGFDAFGDLHFALAGEQGDGAHFAEIHADRVVDGDVVRFGFGGGFLATAVALAVDLLGGLPVFRGRVHDIDFILTKQVHEVVNLIGRHQVGGQNIVDFLVGQVAFLLPQGDQLVDFCDIGNFLDIGHLSGFS